MKSNTNSNSRRSFLRAACCGGGALAISAIRSSSGFACGGVFDVGCNLNHGGMSPQNLQNQGQIILNQAGHVLTEAQVTASGAALAQTIVQSHNTAVNGSARIPITIRQQLTGYASEDSMNRVAYKVGDSGAVNLAHLLEQGGMASAVTLIDVVVFRGPSEADDLSIWAHELTHVDQYREWGVNSFAVQYVRNWHGVENPAYAKGNGYASWAANQGVQTQSGPQFGNFCYVNGGRYGPGAGMPIGSQCVANTAGGQALGTIGP
jgi:hypothetical protein